MLRDRNILLPSTAVTPEIKGSTRAPVLRRGTTYSIVTPSMTLVSPNNDPLNDFDESKQVPIHTLW